MIRKYGQHILGQPQKVVEMLKNYPNEKLFLGA